MKAIFIDRTYDDNSITATGYDFHLRRRRSGEFFLSATYRTRWQGSRTGVRWEADLGLYDKEEALAEAKAVIADLVDGNEHGYGWTFDGPVDDHVQVYAIDWYKTNNGFKVQ